MKAQHLLAIMSLVIATQATAQSPALPHGPSTSPLSWQEQPVQEKTPALPLATDVLGVNAEPAHVATVTLTDNRPYGETNEKLVRLARYESFTIQGPEGLSIAIPITAAFDASTHHLVCASTNPAPVWGGSNALSSSDVEARVNQTWSLAPANYDDLHSSLSEVFRTLWTRWGVNPSKTGQMIIRPRRAASKLMKLDADGKQVAQDPATNMWVVEVLGAVVRQRYGAPLATQIIFLRDHDLRHCGGMLLP